MKTALTVLLFLIAVSLAVTFFMKSEELSRQVASSGSMTGNLKSEIDGLWEENRSLKETLSKKDVELVSAATLKAKYESEVKQLTGQITQLTGTIDKQKAMLDELKAKVSASVSDAQDALKNKLSSALSTS